MYRLIFVAALCVVLAVPASASAAQPQISDPCGETGTGVESPDNDVSVLVEQDRDAAFDIESVALRTLFDVTGRTPVGVTVTLDTCADALPAPELQGSSWLVRWNTPDNAAGERCNATVIVNDAVDPDDAGAGVHRAASLYQVCSRPYDPPLGGAAVIAYTAYSRPLDGAVSFRGGAITWTLRFADLDAGARSFLAPGLEMADPGANTRDGRRITELQLDESFTLHAAAADEASGESFTIGTR